MTLFEELSWRGFVHQTTHPELPSLLARESLTLYAGFDPTADSLHIGSLLPIMALAHFQRAGHRPIVLIGGGTGLIGDPSGKTAERTLLTKEVAETNSQGIRTQLARFLNFRGDKAALMLNNADWLCALSLVDFLRDFGKHFSVNAMLNRESVRHRLEDRDQGISYTEFTYSLLQAYDFYHLAAEHDCRLQVGGSDQWGNIVAGMDLSRRLLDKPTFGLTFPLLTKSDGTKFGKSEGGNIWLDPRRTSDYKFYQFWLNQSDADTPHYLRLFTFLSRPEIDGLAEQIQCEPHLRVAQRRLADEVTRLVRGENGLEQAQKVTSAMFSEKLDGLEPSDLLEIYEGAPSAEIRLPLGKPHPLVDVLVETHVFSSKGEARKLIANGGLYIDGFRIKNPTSTLSVEMSPDSDGVVVSDDNICVTPERTLVLRKGKKNHHLLHVTTAE